MKTIRIVKVPERASKTMARFLLCMVFLISAGVSADAVNAQSDPLMLLSSNPVTFYINTSATQTVDLLAQNVINMQGFEFVLSFDPEFLEFVMVTPSTWLNNLRNYAAISAPGKIHYAYAQVDGTPVNGNGVLATITFRPLAYGKSHLTFTDLNYCKYSNNLYQEIRFSVLPSIVNISYNPDVNSSSSVIGTLSLQGQSSSANLTLMLDDGLYLESGPYTGTSINQSGTNLSISPVVMDLYTVTTTQPRYLNIDADCGKTKAVFGTTSTLNPLRLKGGNAVWTDNEINIQDIAAITGVYGEASTLEAPLDADINANGWVDVFDLAMAAANYGLNCATAYADWTP